MTLIHSTTQKTSELVKFMKVTCQSHTLKYLLHKCSSLYNQVIYSMCTHSIFLWSGGFSLKTRIPLIAKSLQTRLFGKFLIFELFYLVLYLSQTTISSGRIIPWMSPTPWTWDVLPSLTRIHLYSFTWKWKQSSAVAITPQVSHYDSGP